MNKHQDFRNYFLEIFKDTNICMNVESKLIQVNKEITMIEDKFGTHVLSYEGQEKYKNLADIDPDMDAYESFMKRDTEVKVIFDNDFIHQKWKPIKDKLIMTQILLEGMRESKPYKNSKI